MGQLIRVKTKKIQHMLPVLSQQNIKHYQRNDREKGGTSGVSHWLLRNQIALLITEYCVNRGHWATRRIILNSLSQLLYVELWAIDLEEIERLPQTLQPNNTSEVQQLCNPDYASKNADFLGTFRISASRVFSDDM